MNQFDSTSADVWAECSPGTLQQLSHRIRRDQLRKTVLRVSAPLAMIALVALVGVWSAWRPSTPSEFNFGGVTCRQVEADMQRFAMSQLPADTQRAFAVHLANCPHCQERMRTMQRRAMPVEGTANDLTTNVIAERISPHRPREESFSEGFTLHRSLVASGLN